MLFVDGVSIGYATNHTLEIEAETSSFDCKDEGEAGWSNEETIQLNWTVTSENIYAYDPEGKSYENLNDLMISRQPIDVVFYLKAESGSNVPIGGWHSAQDPFRGKAIITDLDMNAPHGEYASFTATFTGWGELVYEELVDYLCTETTVVPGSFYFLKNFEEDENDIEYSLDKTNWTPLASEVETEEFPVGTKVYWRGHFTKTYDPENQYRNGVGTLKCDRPFKVSGNPMSLIRPDIFYTMTDISEYKGAFALLFNGNEESLVDASKLHLKALVLSERCYNGMFSDCYSLEYGPQLPATKLARACYESMFFACNALKEASTLPATVMKEKCYASMFKSCTALKKAPALPAMTLAEACYMDMFSNSGIEAAPQLPATELAQACYASMFNECEYLESVPYLPARKMEESCYLSMFNGCTALWDLTKCPELPATELAKYCYEYMFQGCSNLVVSPDLPATELAPSCYASMFRNCFKLRVAPTLPAINRVPYTAYQYMFYDCSALSSIKCLASSRTTPQGSWTTSLSFVEWMHGVNATGQFIQYTGANWMTGENGIPTNWTVDWANS